MFKKTNSILILLILLSVIIQLNIIYFVNSSSEDLIISENQIITIENTTFIQTGNIIVRDNGTLIIQNGKIQIRKTGDRNKISVEDNGKLILRNATLESHVDVYVQDLASINISEDSNFVTNANLVLSGQSTIYIDSSYLGAGTCSVLGSCESIIISNSVVQVRAFTLNYIGNFTILNSDMGWESNYGDYPHSGEPRMTIGGDLNSFFNATDSRLWNRHLPPTTPLEFRGNIRIFLYNVSTNPPKSSSNTRMSVTQNATLHRYWWLTINVIDKNKLTLSEANVTISHYLNDTIFSWHLTDERGQVKLKILADVITSTKENFVGNYKIKATYGLNCTTQKAVTLDSNRDIVLTLICSPTDERSIISSTENTYSTSQTQTTTNSSTVTTNREEIQSQSQSTYYYVTFGIIIIAIVSALLYLRRKKIATQTVTSAITLSPPFSKYCKKCGKEIPYETAFCNHCGSDQSN